MPLTLQVLQAFDRAVISEIALDDAGALESKLATAARTMREREAWLKPHQRSAILLRAASLLEIHLETGRTHQIRVHLKSLGHPVLGDDTYGWKQDPVMPEISRVMLHAEHLVFAHPIGAKTMDLYAPLPADFKQLLAALKKL